MLFIVAQSPHSHLTVTSQSPLQSPHINLLEKPMYFDKAGAIDREFLLFK